MSEDKFLPESNNYISFVAGERLDAEKLNTLIEIIESQISDLGGVIGDARGIFLDAKHSSFFPTTKNSSDKVIGTQEDLELNIANISRLIGPASALNPRVINHDEERTFIETIPAGETGIDLKFGKDCEIVTVVYYTESNGDFNSSEKKYKFEGGRVYLNQSSASPIAVIYTLRPESFWGTLLSKTNSSYNVIPDPNTPNDQDQLQITYDGVNENYTIVLPVVNYEHINTSLESQELSVEDLNNNVQIKLPKYITKQYEAGDILPKYSVILKNNDLNEIYVDCNYLFSDENTLVMTGIGLGDQDCIDQYNYSLITVGTDITTAIADIRNKLEAHSHNGSFGEKRVSIFELGEVFNSPGEKGVFGPSSVPGNAIPQYLHRDGYQEDNAFENANNAMRGNLRLGNEAFSTLDVNTSITTNDGTSVKLELGNSEDTISLSSGRLTIESKNTNNGAGINIKSSNDIISEAATEIVDSINGEAITVKKDIESNISFFDNFTKATFNRVKDILIRETKDVVEINDWTTFELSPSTSRRPEDYAMPSQETSPYYYFQNRDVELKTNGNLSTITPHYEKTYKYAVVPIKNITDNFYFKFNKVAYRDTPSDDSGIYSGEVPQMITGSYHSYSIQDPNAYISDPAGPYYEDVGDDLFFEDPNIPFYYIALRERVEDINEVEQARISRYDPQNPAAYTNDFLWVETSARYSLNEYFNIEEIQGGVGDNEAKRALWPWLTATNTNGDLDSFSISINLELLPSNYTQILAYEEERHELVRDLIKKNMGLLVERIIDGTPVYRWVDNSKLGLRGKVGYEDEDVGQSPDANLLTKLVLEGFTKEELLIEKEPVEITSVQELYDLLVEKNITLYFTRRHKDRNTCSIPVHFVNENEDGGRSAFYYDFNEVLSQDLASTRPSKRLYSLPNGGTSHVDDWSFIASNRFFITFARDATVIEPTKIVKRKFVLDLIDDLSQYSFKFYRKNYNQIFLVESPQIIFRYIQGTAEDQSLVEKDYLETYNKGGVSQDVLNYNILVSVNGENVFCGKVCNLSITQMIFEYIRRRMAENTRSELGDITRTVSGVDTDILEDDATIRYQSPNTGIFGMHCIVRGEEIVVGNKIILNLELDYTLEEISQTVSLAFKRSSELPTIGMGG